MLDQAEIRNIVTRTVSDSLPYIPQLTKEIRKFLFAIEFGQVEGMPGWSTVETEWSSMLNRFESDQERFIERTVCRLILLYIAVLKDPFSNVPVQYYAETLMEILLSKSDQAVPILNLDNTNIAEEISTHKIEIHNLDFGSESNWYSEFIDQAEVRVSEFAVLKNEASALALLDTVLNSRRFVCTLDRSKIGPELAKLQVQIKQLICNVLANEGFHIITVGKGEALDFVKHELEETTANVGWNARIDRTVKMGLSKHSLVLRKAIVRIQEKSPPSMHDENDLESRISGNP